MVLARPDSLKIPWTVQAKLCLSHGTVHQGTVCTSCREPLDAVPLRQQRRRAEPAASGNQSQPISGGTRLSGSGLPTATAMTYAAILTPLDVAERSVLEVLGSSRRPTAGMPGPDKFAFMICSHVKSEHLRGEGPGGQQGLSVANELSFARTQGVLVSPRLHVPGRFCGRHRPPFHAPERAVLPGASGKVPPSSGQPGFSGQATPPHQRPSGSGRASTGGPRGPLVPPGHNALFGAVWQRGNPGFKGLAGGLAVSPAH